MLDTLVIATVSLGALVFWNVNWWWGYRFTIAQCGPFLTQRFKNAAMYTMVSSAGVSLMILTSMNAGYLLAEYHAYDAAVFLTLVGAASVVLFGVVIHVAAWLGVWPLWFISIARVLFGEAKAVERVEGCLRKNGSFANAVSEHLS
jgi:hypothetical protein